MLYETPVFRAMGDRALLVELGEGIHPLVNRKVREIFFGLERHPLEGILEMVPCYRSLMVVYDPLRIRRTALERRIREDCEKADPSMISEPKMLEVPVVYGGEFGPDLEWVARYHNLTPEDVVRLHTGATYQVYMIGFAPGFPYMGELPDALATPRRETPRLAVPGGSVAIAQKQTGIYPVQSPGGWQILGRTPLRLFDASRWPPTPLETGDMVRFIATEKEEVPAWPS
jgi:inhibitor of KinA